METGEILTYPLPIARGWRRFLNADKGRDRHDAAYYLYEVYLKYCASFAMARYVAGEARDHRVNAVLKGLVRPSLGEWLRFLRECLRFLHGAPGGGGEADAAIAALADLLEAKDVRRPRSVALANRLRSFRAGGSGERERVSLASVLDEIVAYRNRVIGHGAPLGAGHYLEFGALLGDAFPEVLESSPFLKVLRLVSFGRPQVIEGAHVDCPVTSFMGLQPLRASESLRLPYGSATPREESLHLLDGAGSFLPLEPFLVAHREDVYFLNEADGSIEYLSYATGERHRPSSAGDRQQDLFERILGYRVDSSGLSRMGEDCAPVEPAPSATEGTGRVLGDYRIVREVGRGAMGAVFEAIQMSLDRRVALKVLPGAFGLEPKRIERFLREARATARIHHPSIVPVYEVGEAAGTHFYAMEFVDGPSLERAVAARREAAGGRARGSGTGDAERIASAVREMALLADGLHAAHAIGLVHRDVKPSNILVDPGGRWVLVDFGLVHEEAAGTLTRSGEMVGTLAYMSPEQVGRRPVDARCDVYALGATLYEVLTLRPPFTGASDHEIQNAILFKEPVPPRKLDPRLHRDLETIVLRAMEKDPDRRYSSAKEMADDLRRFIRYEPIRARPLSLPARAARWLRRHARAAAAAAAIIVLAGALGISLIGSASGARRAREAE